jgi:hypothetical protein
VDPERQPLLQQHSSPRLGVPRPSLVSDSPPRHSSRDLESYQAAASSSRSESFIKPVATSTVHHSSDEGYSSYSLIMEKVKNSKVAYWADKLAVESEPNLTTAQLMLFNHDLKPVEPERRQWVNTPAFKLQLRNSLTCNCRALGILWASGSVRQRYVQVTILRLTLSSRLFQH